MPTAELWVVLGETLSGSRRCPHDSGGSNSGGNCGAHGQRPIPRGDARPLAMLPGGLVPAAGAHDLGIGIAEDTNARYRALAKTMALLRNAGVEVIYTGIRNFIDAIV
jgi:hypothetical protein